MRAKLTALAAIVVAGFVWVIATPASITITPLIPSSLPSISTKPSAKPKPSSGRACAGFPAPACTGVPSGTALTTVRGDLIVRTPGTMVRGKRVTGQIVIAAAGVTIRDTEIHRGVTGHHNGRSYSFAIIDSTVGPLSGCDGDVAVGYRDYTATRVHVRNFGDGFRVSGGNVLIQDSFVLLCSNPGDHSDGVQGYQGGRNVVVRHNTIDQRQARDVTSPIFFADESAGAVIKDNLLAGGGYTLRLHGSGYTASGNRIVAGSWIHGPVHSDCGGIAWRDNALVTIDRLYAITAVKGPLRCG